MKRLKMLKVEITEIEGNVAKWEMLRRSEPPMYILSILIAFSSIPISILVFLKTSNMDITLATGIGIMFIVKIGHSALLNIYVKKNKTTDSDNHN